MYRKKQLMTAVLAALAMAALTLDAQTAVSGASQGIDLCIKAVIPSLFPFFFLSILLTASLAGHSSPLFDPITKICRIPPGSGSILAVGLLGGYPMGAQSVAQCYMAGGLTKADAERMLGFFSNAGPAFVFGMLASRFRSHGVAAALWFIHIASALLTGMLLPGQANGTCSVIPAETATAGQALRRSVSAMAKVCAWIVLFRVLLAFSDRWLLFRLPATARVLVYGVMELSNGCHALSQIPNDGLRFILASVMLAFGGLCVMAQTVQVTDDAKLGLGQYLPGKLMQAGISLLLAGGAQYVLFAQADRAVFPLWVAIVPVFLVFLPQIKKRGSNLRPLRV